MNMKLTTLFAAAFAVVGFCKTASAVTYPLPTDGSRLIGQNQVITVPEGNTQPLEYFAAEYQMGLSNMLEANPGVDTFLPKGGTVLNIPQQLILPDTVHEGIIINSAEMRLYYYPKGTNTVIVLPIGIGQLGKDTPINWTTKCQKGRQRRRSQHQEHRQLPLGMKSARHLASQHIKIAAQLNAFSEQH